MNTIRILFIAFVLFSLGFLLPLLMMQGAIAPSFFLCFISFGASVSGHFLGFIGQGRLVTERRRKISGHYTRLANLRRAGTMLALSPPRLLSARPAPPQMRATDGH